MKTTDQNEHQPGSASAPATCSLPEAYSFVLGGVAAISPELYGKALEQMAEMTGRKNDAVFRADVAAHCKTLPSPID